MTKESVIGANKAVIVFFEPLKAVILSPYECNFAQQFYSGNKFRHLGFISKDFLLFSFVEKNQNVGQ